MARRREALSEERAPACIGIFISEYQSVMDKVLMVQEDTRVANGRFVWIDNRPMIQ